MALTCKATRKYMILETSDAITQHWQNFVFTCGDVDLRDQYVAVDGEGVADVIQEIGRASCRERVSSPV